MKATKTVLMALAMFLIFQISCDAQDWKSQALATPTRRAKQVKPETTDTYANLLYKLGRNENALEWQEKVVTSSGGDLEIKRNYEKMKNGLKTWSEK